MKLSYYWGGGGGEGILEGTLHTREVGGGEGGISRVWRGKFKNFPNYFGQ